MEILMNMYIKGLKEHKGFHLNKIAGLKNNISVITGKNGSGKTRFLESIQNGSSEVYFDDEIIPNDEVSIVTHLQLNPNINHGYSTDQQQARVTATLRFYEQIKNDLDHPYNKEKASPHQRMAMRGDHGLDYTSLFRLALSIGQKCNKPASQLSDDDIILYFETPETNILGNQSISSISNQYLKRREQNELNEFRNKIKNTAVDFLTENEFIECFGNKPWVVINEILHNTFDGKFQFNIPDESSRSYSYQAQLFQTDTGLQVSVDAMSSGEKTLLWLALTLFNSQYYDTMLIKVPRLLLIDEPDAYLHPKMVVKMYETLTSFQRNFGSKIIITTHSPTTVALAPDDCIFIIEQGTLNPLEKDSAITELLDGITQISLSPENRKQVFVESLYDANIFQLLFSKLVHRSPKIDPKISLSFVSSGPKMPERQIEEKIKQILKIHDTALITNFLQSINGIGSCSQVIGQVGSLTNRGNGSIRGIIDWDGKNRSSSNIIVLGENYAYSIENIVLDPICIMLLIHIQHPDKYPMTDICGKDISISAWLNDTDSLQQSLDNYIQNIFNRENQKDNTLSYLSGCELLTDSEYLNTQGHLLECLIKKAYPQLNAYSKSGRDGELKWEVVNKAMVTYSECKLIPTAFEIAISAVQK